MQKSQNSKQKSTFNNNNAESRTPKAKPAVSSSSKVIQSASAGQGKQKAVASQVQRATSSEKGPSLTRHVVEEAGKRGDERWFRKTEGRRNGSKSMICEGRELLTTLSGPSFDQGELIFRADFNPLNYGVRLPLEAKQWDKYQFRKLAIHFVPAMNQTTGQGQLVMGFTADPEAPEPSPDESGLIELDSFDDSRMMICVEKAQVHNMHLNTMQAPYYVAQNGDPERLTIQTSLFIMAQTDIPASTPALGSWFFVYECEFYDATTQDDNPIGTCFVSTRCDNSIQRPFEYIEFDDGDQSPPTQYARGDCSFVKKISANVLAFEKGTYFFDAYLVHSGTAATYTSPANDASLFVGSPPSVVNPLTQPVIADGGTATTWTQSRAWNFVSRAIPLAGTGLNANLLEGGGAAGLDIGLTGPVNFVGLPSIGGGSTRAFASAFCGSFILFADGEARTFTFDLGTVAVGTPTLAGIFFRLSKISTDTTGVVPRKASSAKLGANVREQTRPWRTRELKMKMDRLIERLAKSENPVAKEAHEILSFSQNADSATTVLVRHKHKKRENANSEFSEMLKEFGVGAGSALMREAMMMLLAA